MKSINVGKKPVHLQQNVKKMKWITHEHIAINAYIALELLMRNYLINHGFINNNEVQSGIFYDKDLNLSKEDKYNLSIYISHIYRILPNPAEYLKLKSFRQFLEYFDYKMNEWV